MTMHPDDTPPAQAQDRYGVEYFHRGWVLWSTRATLAGAEALADVLIRAGSTVRIIDNMTGTIVH